MLFKDIRTSALQIWYSKLGRKRDDKSFSDDLNDSITCNWQSLFWDTNEHCSFFCSFGSWLDNISDMLNCSWFDNVDADSSEDKIDALFRYYTRFLMIFSETVDDLKDFEMNIYNLKSRNWFNLLTDTQKKYKNIIAYTNSVCKHKAEKKNIHRCNQHLQIMFDDFQKNAITEKNIISIDNLDWNQVNCQTKIIVPSLILMVDILTSLIKRLDDIINKDSGILQTLRNKGYVVKECDLP